MDQLISELTTDKNSYIRSLALSYFLRRQTLISVLEFLELPEQSKGLDVGCGIGLPALIAAEKFNLSMTGVDQEAGFIKTAQMLANKTGLDEKTVFLTGNGSALDFEEGVFNWAWSVDFVNYASQMDRQPLNEMIRVLKPGGTLALAAWTFQRLLPGYPHLEALLDATKQGLAPFVKGMEPIRHFMRTPAVLEELGLQNIRSKTVTGEICAPLKNEIKPAVADLMAMRWDKHPDELDEKNRQLFERLTDPEAAEYILDQNGYYGFFTYTVFAAEKKETK